MMKKRWDVLGIGVAAVDDLVFVDHFPQPDDKIPVVDRQRQGGGLVATALVTVARLGGKSAYCACLGRDELSTYTIDELQREGVDCSLIQVVEQARPYHSIVIVDKTAGSRTILYSSQGFREPSPVQLSSEMVRDCRVLLVDSFTLEASSRATQLARAEHIPVVVDVEPPVLPELERLISQVDHLIIGATMGAILSGKEDPPEMVRVLARGPRACTAVTAGERGCWYAEGNGEVFHQPAIQVKVVDTTGCGDVFHGAYAAALAFGEGVPQAIAIASVSAGLKATHPGGRSGISDMATVKKFLAGSASLRQQIG